MAKYRVPGLEINLGAVGKGYALDRAAELLRTEWGVESALLHAGGSSVYAIGRPPGGSPGWAIRLRHPTDETRSLGTIHLADRGLGTSAATFQFFEYNGRKLGHLLDPRTGHPAEGTASVSVCAPTAAEADAMSTALFVLGAIGADRLTRTRPHLAAVVLGESSSPTPASNGGKMVGGPDSSHFSGPDATDGRLGLLTFNLGPAEYTPPEPALSD
jgi:thiamine biosynthesis lipoprotein